MGAYATQELALLYKLPLPLVQSELNFTLTLILLFGCFIISLRMMTFVTASVVGSCLFSSFTTDISSDLF